MEAVVEGMQFAVCSLNELTSFFRQTLFKLWLNYGSVLAD
jgi:hypothetical protein